MDWFDPKARRALLDRALEKAGSKLALSKALGGSRSLIQYWDKPEGPPISKVPRLLKYLDETNPGSL